MIFERQYSRCPIKEFSIADKVETDYAIIMSGGVNEGVRGG